jgi:uncharacterized membrane protein
LKYFEDYNLKRDAEIGQKGCLWMDTTYTTTLTSLFLTTITLLIGFSPTKP